MVHAIGGNDGVVTFDGGAVGRLNRWRARPGTRWAEDTAAGDPADAQTFLRYTWEMEISGFLTTLTDIPGGDPSDLGSVVTVVGKLSNADGKAVTGTGGYRELEIDNGGVDGVGAFTATVFCTEASPLVFV